MATNSRFRLSLFLLLLGSTVALGQGGGGALSGRVSDQQGAVLVGAAVTLRNSDVGLTRHVLTDAQGYYRVFGLPLGRYEVRVERDGFDPAARTDVKLTVAQEAVVDFTLSVRGLSAKLTVPGDAGGIDRTSATLGELVDEKKIRDLPLNGRDITQLIQLQPGVSAIRTDVGDILTGGKGTRITVAGARPSGNTFMLDGTTINNVGNRLASSAAGQLTGVETIREFRVLISSYSAQFSRVTGGVFNIVTKSGANALHGSLFEFLRNDNLDARNFFDLKKPEFKRNQFGFSLGGPIAKDRTFFFGSYEGLREQLGMTVIRTVPDVEARNGVVAGTRVDIAPAVRPYLSLWPLPTLDPAPGDGSALFIRPFTQSASEDFFTVRADHHFSSADSVMARYTVSDSGQLFVSSENFPQFPNQLQNRSQSLTLQETKLFSAVTINEFRFGFARSNPLEDIAPENPYRDLSFIPGQPIGTITISGFDVFGTDRNVPRRLTQNSFQLSDHLTMVRGRHVLGTGFQVERFQYNVVSSSRARGEFTFSSLSDFLRGRVRTFEGLLPQASDVTRGYRQSLVGWYVQDDLKLTRQLTLNAGIRHEFVTVPTEQHGRLNNLHDPLDRAVTVGKPFLTSKANVASRLGFAWDLTGTGKTALRGGFGVFFDQLIAHQWWTSIVRLPPFAITARASGSGVPFPDALASLSPLGRDAIFAVDFDHGQPYVYQYNLNLQREILPDTVVTAAYVGGRGVKLVREADWNIGSPGNPVRRNPNFTRIRFRTWDANSFYNSFQLGINKRFSRGFQVQGSYTVAKSIDDASSGLGRTEFNNGQSRTSDPFNPKSDRGLSSFDVRQNLVINFTVDLPFGADQPLAQGLGGVAEKLVSGWQLNGIAMLSSGVPFTPIIIEDLDRDGTDDNEQRPNLKPGRSHNPRVGRAEQWFDPSAFESLPLGTRGQLGRNTIIGPGLATLDVSVVKNFTIASLSENMRIQFKAEVFNLLNRTNLSTPARSNLEIFTEAGPTAQPLPNVGSITSTATTARQLQFALRIVF